MEHRVGAVVTRLCLTHRWSAGWWWNVASASSRRGSAWYAVDQPVGWISELAPSTRAHLVHRRRPQAAAMPNELAQRLDNFPIAAADDADDAAAAAENASVENRWCQLRDTVQSTALAVLGRAPRQHQDWFDDNDAAIRNLLAEKNRLHLRLSIYAILRQMQLRWSGHLVRMDDERLPKRLFYGDVATGSRRQGGQIRRYKDTLKSSLKRLQINPTNWEELARDRPTWRRTVKTGAAIYEANRIAAAKTKREARKSQLRPVRNAAAQPLPTCPRCQRTFRARIGLVGHLRTNCTSRTAPAIVPPPASSSSLPPTNSDTPSAPPIPSSSSSSSSSLSTAPAAAVQTAVSHITITNTPTNITSPTSPDSSDEDQDYTCPHCDRTFTSHIGLVGHLRIHRTETGEPVPGAPTYTHRTRLHCPHCPRTFTHRMGLFGHMRIHESGIDRSLDTSTPPSPTPNPPPCAPTNHSPADLDATDLNTPHCSPPSSFSFITATTTAASASVAHDFTTAEPDTTSGTTPATSIIRREGQGYICPHCDRTFTSRIGLVGHLRIHRTETGEPVPGAPTYTHRTRLHCPHCPRTFTHRMGLFGHMRIHDDLR
nr:unnamed protein product [Spirometra erinaceieuropaei]